MKKKKKKNFLFIANSFGTDSGDESNIMSYVNPSEAGEKVPPTQVLKGGATGLAGPRHLAVSKSGLLFVANFSGATGITVYEKADAIDGNVAPIRTVSGVKTKLSNVGALFLDEERDILYVSVPISGSQILVFEGATKDTFKGNIAPAREFGIKGIKVSSPSDFVLDREDNLYVANGSNIVVFAKASTQKGDNIAPSRTLTLKKGSFTVLGLFIVQDCLFVVSGDRLLTFAEASKLDGAVKPSTEITGLTNAGSVVVDSGDRAYITQVFPDKYAVVSFDNASTASGAIKKTKPRTIKGDDKTKVKNPQGLCLAEL
jgi:hypothetical protein